MLFSGLENYIILSSLASGFSDGVSGFLSSLKNTGYRKYQKLDVLTVSHVLQLPWCKHGPSFYSTLYLLNLYFKKMLRNMKKIRKS